MKIERHTLPNGLRVVHHHDPSSAMVAVNVLYNVGARDENPEHTGLAHLFEHLMFGGSANVKDFDGELQRAGGQSNAWTSNDFTNFYDILPAHNIETALFLESDRMLRPRLGDEALEIQRGVVLEEFKQTCTNRPYGKFMHHLRNLIYTRHPYRWPVIGATPEHVRNVSREQVQEFFNRHYSPQTAILGVSGNVTADRFFSLAEKWFGDIPAHETAPRNLPQEPEQTSARELTVHDAVPAPMLCLAYPMDRYGTDRYIAADLITDILAAGRSSRFYRRLFLATGLFAEVDASIAGSEDAGFLMINAILNPGVNPGDAEKAIRQEIEILVSDGVTEHELERAKNKSESERTFALLRQGPRASEIAMAEYHGESISDLAERYRRITVDTINETARQIFSPEKCNKLLYT
ncbi:MAG: insulinase family protein [Muribaculaceae bacterium]|nr:insulinase family protein [Muribaculaceae bacterium]